MSDVPEDLDRLNHLLNTIPLECEGMTIGDIAPSSLTCYSIRNAGEHG